MRKKDYEAAFAHFKNACEAIPAGAPATAATKKESQGDHGGCGAKYRCCLPALAGFPSPHSMGPGKIVERRLSGALPFSQAEFRRRIPAIVALVLEMETLGTWD